MGFTVETKRRLSLCLLTLPVLILCSTLIGISIFQTNSWLKQFDGVKINKGVVLAHFLVSIALILAVLLTLAEGDFTIYVIAILFELSELVIATRLWRFGTPIEQMT
jgi:hypothetical protein